MQQNRPKFPFHNRVSKTNATLGMCHVVRFECSRFRNKTWEQCLGAEGRNQLVRRPVDRQLTNLCRSARKARASQLSDGEIAEGHDIAMMMMMWRHLFGQSAWNTTYSGSFVAKALEYLETHCNFFQGSKANASIQRVSTLDRLPGTSGADHRLGSLADLDTR